MGLGLDIITFESLLERVVVMTVLSEEAGSLVELGLVSSLPLLQGHSEAPRSVPEDEEESRLASGEQRSVLVPWPVSEEQEDCTARGDP